MGEAPQQFVAAVMIYDRLADDGAEPRHALAEPRRHPPAVQRKIGAAGAFRHAGESIARIITRGGAPFE